MLAQQLHAQQDPPCALAAASRRVYLARGALLPVEPQMQSPPSLPDLASYADALVADVNRRWSSLETSLDVQDDAIALSFVHPVHEATCIVVLEPDSAQRALVLLSVVVGDWGELRNQPQGASLFLLNPRLITCALGLLPLNDDELAVVLCRRLPAEALPTDDVVPMLEGMMFEYAEAQGWFATAVGGEEEAQPGATAETHPLRPQRPRLIGSLDELADVD